MEVSDEPTVVNSATTLLVRTSVPVSEATTSIQTVSCAMVR